mmetsp:Transcript_8698/g.12583  ORF Transcript_8698/g.12583 Transcript_8698/m.12583 type:complete len:202 (-) Transcript_8698:95-700(-)|eukprot:CAMPEP_0194210446 /NCGR_PEP_ID=MMETSP0156-20130528/8513_1 /TAXON_ID=33649 /ORGANISM="Thalassionema nitzschioides, Strain L26-B" /LENGTH=201 /DNA_ID=CAMNT_0038937795 /DNA_START=40 /DNA_END=645 /DNA_ORIENTATION=+
MYLPFITLIFFASHNGVLSETVTPKRAGLRSPTRVHGRKANLVLEVGDGEDENDSNPAPFECTYHASPVPDHHTLGQHDLNLFSTIWSESFSEFGLVKDGAFEVLDQTIEQNDADVGDSGNRMLYVGGMYGAWLFYYCWLCLIDNLDDGGRRLRDPDAYEGISDHLKDALRASDIEYFKDAECITISCGSYFTDASAGCVM